MKTFTLIFISTLFITSSAGLINISKSGGDYSTITAGLNTAKPGDTVLVNHGTYSEFVKWPAGGSSGGGYIVLKASGDGPVKLDGTGLTATQNNSELMFINDKNYIVIDGIEICNFTTADGNIFLKGLQVEGASGHIKIKNCKIYNITTTNNTTDAAANAVGIFGTNGTTSISDLLIDSCEVYNNKTGYSESISIDGNVDNFKVSHCHVHDNNNIGILIAGYYGECPNAAFDQARHGVISDNLVERCTSCNNPSYSGDCSADGIYSDGGGKSVIERNIISECDIGIEAGAELKGAIDDSMILRDNLIINCNTGGAFIGGYDTGLGWTIHCSFENNTLYMNDRNGTGSGEFLIQKSHDNIIRNNIFYTSSQKTALSNAFNSTYCYNNNFDNNLFYSSSGKDGIDGVSLDKHAVTADPLFANVGTDFHLKSGSPAIDACGIGFTASEGELDLDGNQRKNGGAVDIGAYEYGSEKICYLPDHHNGIGKKNSSLVILVKSENMPNKAYVVTSSGKLLMINGKKTNMIVPIKYLLNKF